VRVDYPRSPGDIFQTLPFFLRDIVYVPV